MMVYIALLRGINVGGHKKIKMVDLREMFEKLGFIDVKTYIQSGNVIFKATQKKTQTLEEKIKKGIATTFGFDLPVLVKSGKEIATILEESPFKNPEDIEAKRVYYALLKTEPESSLVKIMETENYPKEQFKISAKCVYLNYQVKAHEAKLSNNLIERKLKVAATTRNHRTMIKLLEMGIES